MKPSELRIGNYFQWKGYASMGIGIDKIESAQQIADYIDFKEPIPLTPEWLERFGFNFGDYGYASLNGFAGYFYDYGFELAWYELTPCKYVHQLQNLYFALTGEELELKQHA